MSATLYLTEEKIKNLYGCKDKIKRKMLLAEALNLPLCDDDEEDMRSSILLDIFAESLSFSVQHGFSWQQGISVFELMKKLVDTTLGLHLLQATEYFKMVITTDSTLFHAKQINSLVDFVFTFFFNHFHLYKFVFTKDRNVNKNTHYLCVDTPSDIPPLCEGVEYMEWKRLQALKTLEDEHQKKLMENQLQLDVELERLNTVVHDKLLMLRNKGSITRKDLDKIVNETMEIYVAKAGSSIMHMIKESNENVMFEFERSKVGLDTLGKRAGLPLSRKEISRGNNSVKKKNKTRTGK